ncbi:Uncharacterised protein [uncultured archaeon]|nr:Uncharacterised protein [uncultured archaeon]
MVKGKTIKGEVRLGRNKAVAKDMFKEKIGEHIYFLGTTNNHYDDIIIRAADKYKIDPVELKSNSQKESEEGLYSEAIGEAGEVGVAQLRYGLASDFGLKCLDITPRIYERRAEKHRLEYLKSLEKIDWKESNILKNIEATLKKAHDSLPKRQIKLREIIEKSNQETLESLRKASKLGAVELKDAFRKEIQRSEKAIVDNSDKKLLEALRKANGGKGDDRLNVEKSLNAEARYLKGFLNKYGYSEDGSSYDVEQYKKAEVAYKFGNLGEWEKGAECNKDCITTSTVEDVLDLNFDSKDKRVQQVLGKDGRLERLQRYRDTNKPYKFDRIVLAARGEKGAGSIEKAHALLAIKGPLGDEAYVSLNGQIHSDLASACKELKWANPKMNLIKGEGKTLEDAKSKINENWLRENPKEKMGEFILPEIFEESTDEARLDETETGLFANKEALADSITSDELRELQDSLKGEIPESTADSLRESSESAPVGRGTRRPQEPISDSGGESSKF